MTRKIIALILLVAVWGTQSLTAVSQNNDTYISVGTICFMIGAVVGAGLMCIVVVGKDDDHE